MKCCSIHDESGYGLDTSGLRFFKTRFVLAKMDHLNIVFCWVKRVRYILLSGNAYRTSRVVKNGFGLHTILLGKLWDLCHMHNSMLGTAPTPA